MVESIISNAKAYACSEFIFMRQNGMILKIILNSSNSSEELGLGGCIFFVVVVVEEIVLIAFCF